MGIAPHKQGSPLPRLPYPRPNWLWALDPDGGLREQASNFRAWCRDDAFRRTPTKPDMYEAGPEAFLEGWRTSEPLIRADTRVIAFGSCFAALGERTISIVDVAPVFGPAVTQD